MKNQSVICENGHEIVLDRTEAYDASVLNCYAFRRGTDTIDGHSLALGNMVSGFPFKLEDMHFHNSESAYISGMFSAGTADHDKVQWELANETNGYNAKKRISRLNRHLLREDWLEFNIDWMLYVVWNKVKGNVDFRKILLDLPDDAVIIEDSTFQPGRTATIWGTKNKELRKSVVSLKKELKLKGCTQKYMDEKCDEMRLTEGRKSGSFEGKNIMGKILMLCREALKTDLVPPVDFELLRSKNIHLGGKILSFR